MTQDTRQRAAAQRAAASRVILRSGLPLLIGAACIWLLRDRLHGMDFDAVAEVVSTTSLAQWVAAAGATALSFWAIGTYDLVMHRHLRTGVPPRVARIAGAGSIALAQVLGEAKARGEDIGALPVLRRYQEWRRLDTASLALATDLSNKLFSSDNPLLRAARDIGMGAINAMPRLRRGFIREAAGLTGDLPDLMR